MRVLLIFVCLSPLFSQSRDELIQQARKTEIAFAKSMADRNHDAFVSFLAKDTIFLGNSTLKGSEAVAKAWKRFFEKPDAPFSWAPEIVELDAAGRLALSTGPVTGPAGKPAGTFTSVWRREADGQWKIVLDYGCPACDCAGGK